MGVHEYLFALGLVLVFVDFFVSSDILTLIAYVIWTYVLTTFFDVHYLYKIIIGISCWFILIAFHYLLWKKVLQKILDNYICKDKYFGGVDALPGKTGVVKIIDGQKRGKIEEAIYEFDQQNNLQDGDKFTVIRVIEGKIVV